MDNTIDTGDPWDLGEQEQAPPAGGMNPLAEGTGLFGKKQPAAEEPAEEPTAEGDEALPEAALPEPMAADEPAEAEAEDAIESALLELEAADPHDVVDEVDHVLQELEAATTADGDSFELIPPPAPDEISPMYETYSPDLAAEMAEYAPAPVEAVEEPEAVIPPGPAEDGGEQFGFQESAEPASDPIAFEPEPVEEPVAEEPPSPEPVVAAPVIEEPVVEEPVVEEPAVEEPITEAPVAEEDVWEEPELAEPVEIEFGTPNVPEGSEMPTGKATQTVSEETMTRPALLTTDDVAGAKIAPVDMVIAVASVGSPKDVADAMASVLDELRDRCAETGGDVVTGVKTEISSAGDEIMVTAAGTAVSLL